MNKEQFEAEFNRIETNLNESGRTHDIVGLLLGLAESLAETLTSIAAERIEDKSLAKDSLLRGAEQLAETLSGIRKMHEAAAASTAASAAALDALQVPCDE